MSSADEIRSALKKVQALKVGHFVLASGKHSSHYVQVAMLAQHPAEMARLIEEPVRGLGARIPIDAVLSAAVGGIPIGQQVALILGCRAIFSERNEKNRMVLKRNLTLQPGDRILLVEDVITTGGTLEEMKDLVDTSRAEVVGVFAVVNRSGNPLWQGRPVVSLVSLDFPVYDENECPMCRAGEAAHRPGTKKVRVC